MKVKRVKDRLVQTGLWRGVVRMRWKKAACACISVSMVLTLMGSIVQAEGDDLNVNGLETKSSRTQERTMDLSGLNHSPARPTTDEAHLEEDLAMLYKDLDTIPIFSSTGGIGILNDAAFAIAAPEGMAGLGA